MYLQPIFDSRDIMKQLPNETKKFRGVDEFWKHNMKDVKSNANVIRICRT